MKQFVALFWMALLTLVVSAQQLKWPPKSYPLSVPCKVSAEVDYYWGVQRITCIGKANSGYKFRISGVAKHDYESSHSIDLFYIVPNNRLVVAGTYFFPKISKGQKFSFDIVSAFSGYTPAHFSGFFIHDKWLTIPKEDAETKAEDVAEDTAVTPPPPPALKSSIRVDTTEVAAKAVEAEGVATITEKETMPEFPGGANGMNAFLSKNVKYPSEAHKKGVEGRVLVEVTIDRDGSVTDAKIVKHADLSLEKEALRVVGLMPKWKPGMRGETPLRVKMTVPFNFRLAK